MNNLQISEFKVDKYAHLISAIVYYKDEVGSHNIKVTPTGAHETVWNGVERHRSRLPEDDWKKLKDFVHKSWHEARRECY